MSLKIVTALVIMGLAQSSAFDFEARDTRFPIPGFSFISDKNADHAKLSMSCDKGELDYSHGFKNVSAWRFLPGDGSPTITQEIAMEYLFITYEVQASVGDANPKTGRVRCSNRGSTFNISLTASGNDNLCDLAVKMEIMKRDTRFSVTDDLGSAFQSFDVLKDLRVVIWESLADVWPTTFTQAIQKDLPGLIDTVWLCKALLAATPEHFPQPDLHYED